MLFTIVFKNSIKLWMKINLAYWELDIGNINCYSGMAWNKNRKPMTADLSANSFFCPSLHLWSLKKTAKASHFCCNNMALSHYLRSRQHSDKETSQSNIPVITSITNMVAHINKHRWKNKAHYKIKRQTTKANKYTRYRLTHYIVRTKMLVFNCHSDRTWSLCNFIEVRPW